MASTTEAMMENGMKINNAYEALKLAADGQRFFGKYAMDPDSSVDDPQDKTNPVVQHYHFFNLAMKRISEDGDGVNGDKYEEGGAGTPATSLADYWNGRDSPSQDAWSGPVSAFYNTVIDRATAKFMTETPESFDIIGWARVHDDVADDMDIRYEGKGPLFLPVLDGGSEHTDANGVLTLGIIGDDEYDLTLFEDMDEDTEDINDDDLDSLEAMMNEDDDGGSSLDNYIDFETLEVTQEPTDDEWETFADGDIKQAAVILHVMNPQWSLRETANKVETYTGKGTTKTTVGNAYGKYLTEEQQETLTERAKQDGKEGRESGEDAGESLADAMDDEDESDSSAVQVSERDDDAEDGLDDVHHRTLGSAARRIAGDEVPENPKKAQSIAVLRELNAFVDDDGDIMIPTGDGNVTPEEYAEEQAPTPSEGEQPEDGKPEKDDSEDERSPGDLSSSSDEDSDDSTAQPQVMAEAFSDMSDGKNLNLTNALSGAIQSLGKQGNTEALATIFRAMADSQE